jgi:hypothetical protein
MVFFYPSNRMEAMIWILILCWGYCLNSTNLSIQKLGLLLSLYANVYILRSFSIRSKGSNSRIFCSINHPNLKKIFICLIWNIKRNHKMKKLITYQMKL